MVVNMENEQKTISDFEFQKTEYTIRFAFNRLSECGDIWKTILKNEARYWNDEQREQIMNLVDSRLDQAFIRDYDDGLYVEQWEQFMCAINPKTYWKLTFKGYDIESDEEMHEVIYCYKYKKQYFELYTDDLIDLHCMIDAHKLN